MEKRVRGRTEVSRLSPAVPELVTLFTVLFLAAGLACAQTTTGTIVGTVSDVSGGVLPGVSVSVIQGETAVRRDTLTNEHGQYTISLLPIGHYAVEAELTGFKRAKVEDVLLQVNQTVRIDLILQVGEVQDTVEVRSEIPLVKTDRSDMGVVVDSRKVIELPLNGRSFFQLAALAPGTMPIGKVDSILDGFGGGIVANGASSNATMVTLDGIENVDANNHRVSVKPNPDALAEFKIMTATYSAEYGRGAGANINMVIKSGTNQFHGSAFAFHRNDNLDARNFFDQGEPPEFKQNQYGFTLGGPVVRDKMFFFGSFEGFRIRKGLTSTTILPTDAQRNGDLSTGYPIYDPLTTRKDPATGKIIRDPFPGNAIPASRITPQARKALELLWPGAQQQIADKNNTVLNPLKWDDQDQVIFRLDHQIDNQTTLWGRYVFNHHPYIDPVYSNPGIPGQGTVYDFTQQNVVVTLNRTLSPTLVNDARAGFNRYVQELVPETADMDYMGEIGVDGTLRDRAAWGPPNISVAGMASVGCFQFSPSRPKTNTYQYMDTLAWTKGSHVLKMGADIKRTHMNGIQFPNARGNYSFSGGMTRDPQRPVGTGQGIADLLLGLPTSAGLTFGKNDNDLRYLFASFFLQDDWSFQRDITLNLGIRYNYMPQPVSARDRVAIWSEEDQAIVTAQSDRNWPVASYGAEGRTLQQIMDDFKGIFSFKTAPEVGWPRSLTGSDNNNFEPRVGIAWRMFGSNRTILRAGFGRFYEMLTGSINWNTAGNAPYSRSLSFSQDVNGLPALFFAAPFPSTTVQGAPGITLGRIHDWQDPYQDNWNLTLEHRLTRSASAEVAYVGSRGHHQVMSVDFNDPVFGIGSGQLRRPHPERGGSGNNVSWGRRWYDSLQTKVETRSNSVSMVAAYTYAKALSNGGGGINEVLTGALHGWNLFGVRSTIPGGSLPDDDYILTYGKGLGSAHMPHRLSVAYVWELPFGKGKRYGLEGLADRIFGGWALSGATVYEAGVPRPVGGMRNGDPNNGPKTVEQWFNTSVFSAARPTAQWDPKTMDPSDRALVLQFLGNCGRACVMGPGIQNWDFAALKSFQVREAYRLQFRTELFNALNHANFGFPEHQFRLEDFRPDFQCLRWKADSVRIAIRLLTG
ncbi:MAG: carboxypeptidase regulatory-like domain-containing protein [Acidobacteriota bacterium]